MSAQAILSMIAPALPATPQGPSVADASGFGDLLAHLLSTEAAASSAMAAAPPAEAAVAPVDAAIPSGEEAAQVIEAAAPLLNAVAPAVEETVSPAEETTSDDEPASSAESETLPPAASSLPAVEPPPVPVVTNAGGQLPPTGEGEDVIAAVAPASDADTAPEPGVVQAGSASPTEKAPAKDNGPQETASGKGAAGLTVPSTPGDDVAPALPPKGAAAASALSGGQPEAVRVQTAPTPAPAHPSPAPLRALAERASRPLDQAAPTTDTAPSAEAKPAGSSSLPPSTPAGQTGKPASAVAAAPAAALDPGSTPAETGPVADPVAERTEAAAPARDQSLSTLSRATVDATAQIAAQIQRRLDGRSTRFEIALRPDELGRVDVKLDIDAEGRLSARLAFDNPAAATDLRGRADELRRQLEAAGFHLAEDAFEFAERDSGSSAFDRGEDPRQGQNRAFAAAARLNADIDIAQPPQWLSRSLSPSGVDMKV